MAHRKSHEDLAYGDYHAQGGAEADNQESDRGFIGDTFKKFTGRKNENQAGYEVSAD